jgi:RNA polymerase sigma factor (sigma-70 family)
MASQSVTDFLRQLRNLVPHRVPAEATDAQLLERFLTSRDEAAFAVLVQRHGPMVLAVCRRLLHDAHEVEDAFQAVFLILVRKADSLDRRELLANWLYGVAYRVAVRARATRCRRGSREKLGVDMETVKGEDASPGPELDAILHEEVDRLPPKFRSPVVLCYLQGKTREEAAHELGCSGGAVKGRLERARDLLRVRLVRRGFDLSAITVSTALAHQAANAAVPATLAHATVKAALSVHAGMALVSAGLSAPAAALATAILETETGVQVSSTALMLLKIVKLMLIVTCVMLGLGLLWPLVAHVAKVEKQQKTIKELGLLSQAIASFKVKFNVDYIPSRIYLGQKQSDFNMGNKLQADSWSYLNRVWPRLNWSKPIDWSGGDKEFTSAVLEGDQCLVFFLGGIPDSQGGQRRCAGFSTNPTNPTDLAGDRVCFFDFDPARLISVHGNAFYSFLDPFRQQPYAYFSSYKTANGYNRYYLDPGGNDCALLGVWPYAEVWGDQPRYQKPNSYQIISAGVDGKFGSGTVPPDGQTWPPATDMAPEGRDDLANFSDKPLGVVDR